MGYKHIAQKYQDILNMAEPFLLTYPGNLSRFDLEPFGLKIYPSNIYSCIDAKKAGFFDALQMLDKYSFGPMGMPMDKWVFFDCSEMPGGVFGLGLRASTMPQDILKNIYGVDKNCDFLIPISQYIAIPMACGDMWFGHNLASANTYMGDKMPLSGLALLTKAFGVKCLNFKKSMGATQCESGSLNIHLQLADMEVHSAYTPAHSFNKTMTYCSNYPDEALLQALSGKERVALQCDEWVDVTKDMVDEKYFIGLQKKIEQGAMFKLVGRPLLKDGKTYLPMNYHW